MKAGKILLTIVLLLYVFTTTAQPNSNTDTTRKALIEKTWTNGFEFVKYTSHDQYKTMGYNDLSSDDENTLILLGGTLHEFGTSLYIKQIGDNFFLDNQRDYQLFPPGSRIIYDEPNNALIFRHPTNDMLEGVLKEIPKNMNLRSLMEQDLFLYILNGTYIENNSKTNIPITFSEPYKVQSALFSAEKYTFAEEYDIPTKILKIGNKIFGFKNSLNGLKLTPLKYDDNTDFYNQIKGERLIVLNKLDQEDNLDFKRLSTSILTSQQIMHYAGHNPYDLGVASQKAEINQMLYTLSVMRNQIFARHGYIFKNEKWKDYFSKKKWYKPVSNDVNQSLSDIEKINIEHILLLEKKWKKELESASAGNIKQIILDLYAIQELKGMEIEPISEPSSSEKYYTIKVGKKNQKGIIPSPIWFHVYVDPIYEIKVYDVVMDEETTLSNWLKTNE